MTGDCQLVLESRRTLSHCKADWLILRAGTGSSQSLLSAIEVHCRLIVEVVLRSHILADDVVFWY